MTLTTAPDFSSLPAKLTGLKPVLWFLSRIALEVDIQGIDFLSFDSRSHPSPAVPSQPGTPEATAVGKEHIIIEWMKPETDGGNEIKTYIVEKREKSSTRSEQLLKNSNQLLFPYIKNASNVCLFL